MRIIWIVDNKYRELYGLYDLKKKLLNNKIKLYLFHIPVWKTAIDFINPNIVIVPNLLKSSCGPIVEYAHKKKINILMHSSEGMFYSDETQREKYPLALIKKIDKVLAWSKQDAKYLIKKGFKKKVLISGNLKFDRKNFFNKKAANKKINVIGVPTHSRGISGYGITKNNFPFYIRKWIENNQETKIGFLKFEIEYIVSLVNILKNINKNLKVVIKASPFEDPEIYRKTFPEFEIFKGYDIRGFLKKVDVILNVHSSTAVDAFKFGIPVINIKKFIKWDKSLINDKNIGPLAKSGAGSLSIVPKNIFELNKLLKKSRKDLFKLCEKKNLIKKADSLAVTSDTLGIFTNLFLNYKKNISNKNVNYLIIVKYIIVEIRQFFFRKRHKTLFRLWSLKDRKLLKSLRLE